MVNKVLTILHMLVVVALCGSWGVYVADAWGAVSLRYALFCVTPETVLPLVVVTLVPACLVAKGKPVAAGLVDTGLAALLGAMGIALGGWMGLGAAVATLLLGIATMVFGEGRKTVSQDKMAANAQIASQETTCPRSHVKGASHAPRARH